MDTFNRIFRVGILLSFIGVSSGCANLGGLKSVTDVIQPKVNFSHVSVSDFSKDTLDLNVGLDVDNPNPVAIKLAGYDYQLLINDQQLSKGKQDINTTIAASTKSKTEFPVSLKFSELFNMAKSLKNSKEMEYEIRSTAYLDLPIIGPVPIRSSNKGRLPVPSEPKISVQKINLKSMSFTGADLEVEINVFNPNSFAIDITQLDYQVSVAKQHWASASVKKAMNLKPDTDNKILVPVSLNLLDMGGSILEVLSGTNEIPYQVKGNIQFDTSLPLVKNINLPIDYVASTQIIK